MSLSKSKIFSYSSDIGELILTSSPNSSDIFVNSGLDGRCFRAHRLVLGSVSPVLEKVLDTSCQFCGVEPEDSTALTFAQVPGSILESFLALCYTGVSLSLKTDDEESELRQFCSELRLFSSESLTRSPVSSQFDIPTSLSEEEAPSVGYIECENLRTFLVNDVLKLASVVNPDIVEHNFEDLIAEGHLQ